MLLEKHAQSVIVKGIIFRKDEALTKKMYVMPTYMVAIWSTQQLCPLEQEFSASDAPATTPLTFQQLQPGSPEETCPACGPEDQCSSMAWASRRVMGLGPINGGVGHLLNFPDWAPGM